MLEELTDIALGRRDYPDVDRAGNPVVRPVPMTQRLKALELLGKRYGLFTDRVDVSGSLPVILAGEDALDD